MGYRCCYSFNKLNFYYPRHLSLKMQVDFIVVTIFGIKDICLCLSVNAVAFQATHYITDCVLDILKVQCFMNNG